MEQSDNLMISASSQEESSLTQQFSAFQQSQTNQENSLEPSTSDLLQIFSPDKFGYEDFPVEQDDNLDDVINSEENDDDYNNDDYMDDYYDNIFVSDDSDHFHVSLTIEKEIGWSIINGEQRPDYFTKKISTLKTGWICFYTDVSWSEWADHIGIASVCPSLKTIEKGRVSSNFTKTQGEAIAIMMALDHFSENSNIQKAIICTNSLIILETLEHLRVVDFADFTIMDIQIRCDRIHDMEKEVEFWWCPSDMGIHGIDEASEAAEDARLRPLD